MTSRMHVLWAVIWALLALAIAAYGLALGLSGPGDTGFKAHVAPYWPVAATHFIAGAFALVLGPTQFLPMLRARVPRLHRWMGRGYVLAVLASGGAGLYMAFRAQGDVWTALGFGALAVAWLGSLALAWRAVRARRFDEHRRWMLRNYALTLAAVSLRLQLPTYLAGVGLDFPTAYLIVAWGCWVPNLVIAEWWLRRR